MVKGDQVFQQMLSVSQHKLTRNVVRTILLSIFAGIFIAIGSVAFLTVGASVSKKSLAYILGGCVFPIGLIPVVFFGADLFTSSTINVYVPIIRKKYLSNFLINILIVFLFNFIGAILIALITWGTGAFAKDSENYKYLVQVAATKLSDKYFAIFLKAIMCNILVSGAVVLSYFSGSVIGKAFMIWFPIMIFVLLGYEHSVANMFYYSLIFYTKIGSGLVGRMASNMALVTLGNIVGGMIIGAFVLLLKTPRSKAVYQAQETVYYEEPGEF